MTTKNYIMKAALIVTLLFGSAIRSESQKTMTEQNQFDNWTSASDQAIKNNTQKGAINDNNEQINSKDAKFGSGMAQGIFQRQTQGIQGPTADDARNNSNSREDNLLNMQSDASSGAGIAIGLGAAMIATGIPMSMDILNIPRMIAGLELIAKGGMEIAQGASRAESANDYGVQRGMLNSAQNSANFDAPSIPIADEDLKKLLANSDMTPQEFKTRLANGEFQSGAAILKAIGREVDPELLKEGQAIANAKMGDIFDKAKADNATNLAQTLTGNNENKNENSSQEGGAQNKYNQNPDSKKNESAEVASNNPEGTSKKSEDSNSKSSKSSSREVAATEKGANGANDIASLYSKLFGPGAQGDLSAEQNRFRQELAEIGISLPVKGVSIFALAHRQYHEFGKYRKALPRKQARVAQR